MLDTHVYVSFTLCVANTVMNSTARNASKKNKSMTAHGKREPLKAHTLHMHKPIHEVE